MKKVNFSDFFPNNRLFRNVVKSILFTILLLISFENSGKVKFNNSISNFNSLKLPTAQGKFVLTHLLGKRMKNDAHFKLTGETQWTLDFRNGDKIKYNVISYNKNNQLCGMKCVDSNGDKCEICISKQSGNETVITFKYNKGTLTYKGYYE